MTADSKPVDTANEPVDRNDDDEFMDTGVLHEPKPKQGKPVRGMHAQKIEDDE